MVKKVLTIVISMYLIILFAGCAVNKSEIDDKSVVTKDKTESAKELSTINLLITRDYGNQVIFEEEITLDGDLTIYDVMVDSLELQTDYGGGFISEINGLASETDKTSGKRLDWFYYVNGITADVGPLDYDLKPGDKIWWDYHEWKSMEAVNSTVIGSYPEPFLHGYRGEVKDTILLVTDTESTLTESFKQQLVSAGIEGITVEQIRDELLTNRQGPTIVLGTWDELKHFEMTNNLNDEYKKVGTYIYYGDENVKVMNAANEEAKTFAEHTGTITSHGEGLGDDTPLWIISGTDETGLLLAIETLANYTTDLEKTYSLAVTEDEVIKLPTD